jgi:hypothetical protein
MYSKLSLESGIVIELFTENPSPSPFPRSIESSQIALIDACNAVTSVIRHSSFSRMKSRVLSSEGVDVGQAIKNFFKMIGEKILALLKAVGRFFETIWKFVTGQKWKKVKQDVASGKAKAKSKLLPGYQEKKDELIRYRKEATETVERLREEVNKCMANLDAYTNEEHHKNTIVNEESTVYDRISLAIDGANSALRHLDDIQADIKIFETHEGKKSAYTAEDVTIFMKGHVAHIDDDLQYLGEHMAKAKKALEDRYKELQNFGMRATRKPRIGERETNNDGTVNVSTEESMKYLTMATNIETLYIKVFGESPEFALIRDAVTSSSGEDSENS